MRNYLSLLFVLISSFLYGQVSWGYSHSKISEDEVELTFKAKIDKTWKLYSQQDYENSFDAPIPLEFHFIQNASYEIITSPKDCWDPEKHGEDCIIYLISEENPRESFDEMFEMDVKYFTDETVFTQKIRVKDNQELIRVPVQVLYQACDPNFCISLDDEYEFQFMLANIDLESDGDISGCMDSEALNYSPFANIDNGSCIYPKLGCMDPAAINYDKSATKDDESCRFKKKDINKYIDNLVDLENPVNTCITSDESKEDSNSLWWIFFLGISGGLLALITPCVFPMIPLTVSFFTKSDSKKGIFNAIMYGFFIMFIYFLLSIPFHIIPDIDPGILNQISTNTWLNIVFFLIFMFFAFSFFGYYELTLPSNWGNKADSGSNIGGLIGVFFMALTLAIVSFSCTGPILGTLLAGALGGDVTTLTFMGIEMKMVATKLTVGMTGFGLALGFPFAIFALFPRLLDSLPQSGGWLNSVKVVLGFLEVALAIKFLSNADMVEQWGLIKRETYFILWFIVSVLTVLYLVGKIRFPHDSPLSKISKARYGFIILFISFSIYLIPGMFGSYINWWEHKLLSGFPPALSYSYTYPKEEAVKDYWEAIEEAKKSDKPIFIDFTGHNCTNCRDMEENVFPEVKDLLDQYVICKLYVDERVPLSKEETVIVERDGKQKREVLTTVGDQWSTLQEQTYHMTAQPWYVLYSHKDGLLTEPIGRSDVDEFEEWLQCGLDAFNNNQKKMGLTNNN